MSELYCHDCHTQISEHEEVRVSIEEYEGPECPHPHEMTGDDGHEWKVTYIILCGECGGEYEI